MHEIATYVITRAFPDGDDTRSVVAVTAEPRKFAKGLPTDIQGLVLEITPSKIVSARPCSYDPQAKILTDANMDEYTIDAAFVLNHGSPQNAIREASPRLFGTPPGIRDWNALEQTLNAAIGKMYRDKGYAKALVSYDFNSNSFSVQSDTVSQTAAAAAAAASAGTKVKRSPGKGPAKAPVIAGSKRKSLTGIWLQGRGSN